MNEEVVHYITQAREYGLKDTDIKTNLVAAGWPAAAVEQSFVFLARQGSHAQQDTLVPVTEAPRIATAQQLSSSTATQRSSRRTRWLLIGLFMVGVLGVSGYGIAHQTGYWLEGFTLQSQDKIWQGFTNTESSGDFERLLAVKYEDATDSKSKTPLKHLVLNLKGSLRQHRTATQATSSEADLTYTISQNDIRLENTLGYKTIGEDLYLTTDNPSLLQLLTGSDSSQASWVKLTQPADTKILSAIFGNNTLKSYLEQPRFLGRETINGIPTAHYEAQFNLSTFIQALEQQLGPQPNEGTAKLIQLLTTKIEITKMEVWIGSKDHLLYKVHGSAMAPSLVTLGNTALSEDPNLFKHLGSSLGAKTELPKDAQRIADMRNLASALELYYNDHQGYPQATDGKPSALVPKYISALPEAPAATGTCTDYHTTYWYSTSGAGKGSPPDFPTYTVSFCLGNDTSGFQAGMGSLSPSGMSTTTSCTDTVHPCFTEKSPSTSLNIENLFDQLPNTGIVTFDATYKNYNRTEPVKPPSDFKDISNQTPIVNPE
jgi:hypothetical protein